VNVLGDIGEPTVVFRDSDEPCQTRLGVESPGVEGVVGGERADWRVVSVHLPVGFSRHLVEVLLEVRRRFAEIVDVCQRLYDGTHRLAVWRGCISRDDVLDTLRDIFQMVGEYDPVTAVFRRVRVPDRHLRRTPPFGHRRAKPRCLEHGEASHPGCTCRR